MIDISSYSTSTKILALCRHAGVTPCMFESMVGRLGSVDSILLTDTQTIAGINGISATIAKKVSNTAKKLAETEKYAMSLHDRGIELINRLDSSYPHLLFELNDPPPLLFLRGNIPDYSKKTITLVGTSQPTNNGLELTSRLARIFIENNVQIISSLLGGIDAAAHLACRNVDSASFAVIDSGFDTINQTESMPVAIDIVQSGGVISEYIPDIKPSDKTMKESNRLLVGMAQGVVVTEVYADSKRTHDLLVACREIGKLVFFMTNPKHGVLADEKSLAMAMDNGAIPIEGYENVDDIIRSLV